MRYRTRIYNSGEDYPRTLKTQLPADHRVDVEFNGFIVSLIETNTGELAVNVEINTMRQPQDSWAVASSSGAMYKAGMWVGEKFYLADAEGRPRGSLTPPRPRSGERSTTRKSDAHREQRVGTVHEEGEA